MSCLITFNNAPTTGVLSGSPSTSGVFDYLGYATTAAGTFGAGGNFPNTTPSYGDSVDVSATQGGFYKFKYKANLPPADPCYGEVEFVIAVKQGTTDMGIDQNISVCSNDAIRNIFDDAGLYDPSVVNGLTYTIAGSGTTSPGYSANNANDVSDDTYDASQESSYPQTRVFTITGTPVAISGTTQSGCDNCQAKTVTVTYTVTEAFDGGNPSNIAVCNDGDV